MVAKRGKTCSRSEKEFNFKKTVGSEGCVSTFTDKTWKVTKQALIVEKIEKVGTLYLCKSNVDSSIALAYIGADTTLWHHRLWNMNEKGVQIL